MRKTLVAAVLACSTLSLAGAPIVAEAAPKRVWVCRSDRHVRHSANTGTVVGAVAGGLLGNAVSSGGGKTGGTLIGAGAGAVAGHQIAKHRSRKDCHWEYRR